MGKQSKSKKAAAEGVIGKGKVTPVQVAFIVDRYLSDNNFVGTRSCFRSEASHLISKSPVNEAPKSLLSLGDMLDEYICLKEQKVFLHQEKNRLEQEKFRVQTLLRGMQDVMNAYNTSPPFLKPPPPPLPLSAPVNNNPVLMSTSKTPLPDPSHFSTPIASTSTSQPTLKRRKASKDAPLASSKRTRTQSSVKPPAPTNQLQITPLQGSSVAKCLFNPAPQTPSPSPTLVSPADDNQTPPFTSTNRTVITSETIQVSPMKQVSYYSIQRDHCITSPIKRFTTTRDHVKGRLDFDDENTTSETDAFDFDLPNLDCLGPDFNFTDLLGDFDLHADSFYQPGSSPEPLSGSPDTMVNGSAGDHELLSGMSSTLTEIRSEKGMNVADAGPNSVTSVKSITKCIKVFSPVKSRNP